MDFIENNTSKKISTNWWKDNKALEENSNKVQF